MAEPNIKHVSGDVLEEDVELTLTEICQVCSMSAEQINELIEFGVVEPQGSQPEHWRFRGIYVQRIRCSQRLQRDLGVNSAGAALALDLLEELERLRTRLYRFERQHTD